MSARTMLEQLTVVRHCAESSTIRGQVCQAVRNTRGSRTLALYSGNCHFFRTRQRPLAPAWPNTAARSMRALQSTPSVTGRRRAVVRCAYAETAAVASSTIAAGLSSPLVQSTWGVSAQGDTAVVTTYHSKQVLRLRRWSACSCRLTLTVCTTALQVWAVLLSCGAGGFLSEKYALGRALTAPLVATILALVGRALKAELHNSCARCDIGSHVAFGISDH